MAQSNDVCVCEQSFRGARSTIEISGVRVGTRSARYARWHHPHPSPLPPAGEGARASGRRERGRSGPPLETVPGLLSCRIQTSVSEPVTVSSFSKQHSYTTSGKEPTSRRCRRCKTRAWLDSLVRTKNGTKNGVRDNSKASSAAL